MTRLSASMRPRIASRVKPSVRNTASSVTRSRAVIAIVLAAMRRMTKATIVAIDVRRSFTFPIIETKVIWKAFSVSVFVG